MRVRDLFKKRPGNMAWMSGSDTRLDQQGNCDEPVNRLPVKCGICGFVDVDRVPKPYKLVKARVGSPADLSPAAMGCFLARDRARQVLEAVVPGQLRFHPTVLLGRESETTPWSLAVPVHLVDPFRVKPGIPQCPRCGEPRTAHYGSQCEHSAVLDMPFDVARSRQWTSGDVIAEERQSAFQRIVYQMTRDPKDKPPRPLPKALRDRPSPEHPWTRDGVDRILYFSRRLVLLLRELKVKGLTAAPMADLAATPADREWVKRQLARVNAGPRAGARERGGSPDGRLDAKRWFAAYLRDHGREASGRAADFADVERRLKVKLPESYKRFVSKTRRRSFDDVLAQEGFTATILPPTKLPSSGRMMPGRARRGSADPGTRSPSSSPPRDKGTASSSSQRPGTRASRPCRTTTTRPTS